jgi:putative oxidoreductase
MAPTWFLLPYLSVRLRHAGCARHLHRQGAMRTTDEALRVVNQRPLVASDRRADAGARGRGDLALLALRVIAGLALALAHGINKLPPTERFVAGVAEMGFPAPMLFAWAAGLAEFAGGLLLALGLFTRPAAFFIAFTMAVATFVRQAGDPFTEREAAVLHGAIALFFLVVGPGRLSLDATFGRKLPGRGRGAS